MKKHLLIILIMFPLNLLYAQNMPDLAEDEISGLTISNTREFGGSSLWGYINGGADLYLEYGFDRLKVLDVELDDRVLIVNIYRMKDPGAAFGIYSVSWFDCGKELEAIKYSCITDYQLQLVRSNYYISIINERGDIQAGAAAVKVAGKLLEKIEGGDFELPGVFADRKLADLMPAARYCRGRLGLENGLPFWSKYFEGLDDFEVLQLNPGSKEGKTYIHFTSPGDMNIFFERWEVECDVIMHSKTSYIILIPSF